MARGDPIVTDEPFVMAMADAREINKIKKHKNFFCIYMYIFVFTCIYFIHIIYIMNKYI